MRKSLKYLLVVPIILYAFKCVKFGVRREKVLLSKISHDINKLKQ